MIRQIGASRHLSGRPFAFPAGRGSNEVGSLFSVKKGRHGLRGQIVATPETVCTIGIIINIRPSLTAAPGPTWVSRLFRMYYHYLKL